MKDRGREGGIGRKEESRVEGRGMKGGRAEGRELEGGMRQGA